MIEKVFHSQGEVYRKEIYRPLFTLIGDEGRKDLDFLA